MFGLAAINWSSAPDRMPVHWNVDGQPDRYGSKAEGLLLLPVIALGIYLLFRVLPLIDPKRANYAQFSGAYSVIRLAVLAFLAVIYGVVLLWMRGIEVELRTVLPIALGMLFLILGAALPRIRPNWLVGIRTPWTLTSDVVWTRTHQLGGALFMAIGVFSLLVAVVSPRVAFYATVGMVLVAVVAVTVLSYVIWRREQHTTA